MKTELETVHEPEVLPQLVGMNPGRGEDSLPVPVCTAGEESDEFDEDDFDDDFDDDFEEEYEDFDEEGLFGDEEGGEESDEDQEDDFEDSDDTEAGEDEFDEFEEEL